MALSLQVIERDRGKYKGSVRQDEDRYILLEYFESHTVIKICVLQHVLACLNPRDNLISFLRVVITHLCRFTRQ